MHSRSGAISCAPTTRRPFSSIKRDNHPQHRIVATSDSSVRIVDGNFTSVFSVGRTSRHSGRRRTHAGHDDAVDAVAFKSAVEGGKIADADDSMVEAFQERSASSLSATMKGFSPARRAAAPRHKTAEGRCPR